MKYLKNVGKVQMFTLTYSVVNIYCEVRGLSKSMYIILDFCHNGKWMIELKSGYS